MSLVGRDSEVRLLADNLENARRGRGMFVLIEGEAGSGKTTLLRSTVALASGFAVFSAAGHEVDRERPFGLMADALLVRASLPDRQRSEIARALRTGGTGGFGEAARYRIVEDLVALVERAALARPVLVALDDLHWADDPSQLAAHHLARRISHLPICVIVARRPVLVNSGRDDLGELAVDLGAPRIVLRPLAEADVAQLAENILGVAPAPGLTTLLSKAGGNPFFVTELLAALKEDRSIGLDGAQAEVALTEARPELRMVILRRLSGLSPDTVQVLRLASVLGTTFAASDLALALGIQPTDLVAPLDEAIRAGVLQAADDRLAFRHDLVRSALYGDVPASMRNALHLQVAHALHRSGAAASHVAPHFAAGATFGDEEAIAGLQSAAEDVASTEPETAQRWLSRALELLDPTDKRYDELVLDLCRLALRLGDAARAEELARAALARDQPPSRRSVLVRTLAAAMDLQDRCLEAAVVSEEASRATDLGDVERIRLAAEAVEYRGHVERVGADREARAVLERATQVGDDVAIRCVRAALYHAAMWSGDFHEAVALGEQIAAQPDGEDTLIVTTGVVGGALARAGRTQEALASLRSEMTLLEAQRDVRPMALILTELAMLEVGEGHWDEAISDVEAALSLATEFRQEVRHDEAVALLAILTTRRGEYDRAARVLGTLYSSRQFVAGLALAKHAAATGDEPRGLTILRDAWDLARTMGRVSDLPDYAPDLVRLELAIGDPARAAAATNEVEELARATRVAPFELTALRCAGLVAADPERLLEAARAAGAMGLVDDQAAALEDAGMSFAAAGAATAAVPPLLEAVDYYERVGAVHDQRRVDAALRAQGVKRGQRGQRARPKVGWESLTNTERSVVELAGEGLTNSEVGARLFISGRTVERHLTHVYSKLGIGSRVELAAALAEQRPRR